MPGVGSPELLTIIIATGFSLLSSDNSCTPLDAPEERILLFVVGISSLNF